MFEVLSAPEFKAWFTSLRDGLGKAHIANRLDRLQASGREDRCFAVDRWRQEVSATGYSKSKGNREAMASVKDLPRFDAAEYLDSDEAIGEFIALAMETADPKYIAHAFGVVARAKGMAKIAEETGLSREQLYRSFSENGNPTLKTVLSVLKSLGLELRAQPVARKKPRATRRASHAGRVR